MVCHAIYGKSGVRLTVTLTPCKMEKKFRHRHPTFWSCHFLDYRRRHVSHLYVLKSSSKKHPRCRDTMERYINWFGMSTKFPIFLYPGHLQFRNHTYLYLESLGLSWFETINSLKYVSFESRPTVSELCPSQMDTLYLPVARALRFATILCLKVDMNVILYLSLQKICMVYISTGQVRIAHQVCLLGAIIRLPPRIGIP